MPIKWSALKVSEAMDMVEEFIDQSAEPLEQARLVAIAARGIADIPQYIDERLAHLTASIGRIDHIKGSIKAVRESLPVGAAVEERKRIESGNQLVLVA
ncbi:hypothetical protein DEALK_06570 [Dehalogenimonas alkenigignens]|uniref:Uncharacterized protein n=1 Tax=Dehalogenimonas alkenigignens TaxID=1217799 RepID=A0A0W0GGX8_9CHLR|nr:hypothetical protein [Dehalogenimonas alkenigignens]KTB47812.1 hypothetical protein DEALK_06570 [Dehalogenimonas alkenigignens]